MWEQVDRAGIQGVSDRRAPRCVSQTKTNGALFRQFGVGADIPLDGLAASTTRRA